MPNAFRGKHPGKVRAQLVGARLRRIRNLRRCAALGAAADAAGISPALRDYLVTRLPFALADEMAGVLAARELSV